MWFFHTLNTGDDVFKGVGWRGVPARDQTAANGQTGEDSRLKQAMCKASLAGPRVGGIKPTKSSSKSSQTWRGDWQKEQEEENAAKKEDQREEHTARETELEEGRAAEEEDATEQELEKAKDKEHSERQEVLKMINSLKERIQQLETKADKELPRPSQSRPASSASSQSRPASSASNLSGLSEVLPTRASGHGCSCAERQVCPGSAPALRVLSGCRVKKWK